MDLGEAYIKVLDLSKKKIYVDPDIEENYSEDKSYLFFKQLISLITSNK